ncbi:response regulator transcription factor [Roseomonas fluvialis]|uniref:Response regulator n=1 Tax=Roseomonas fluvialis TaxID=1750527 RepID=A0ABM7Y8Q2_9PROT|nr:response regulator [Roseomonas fluvialis]BDG74358.1 response regulator [Roseomonas fluvialis]
MSHAAQIAIVDDDDAVRNALSSLLRSFGYAIRGYQSAEAFLDDRDHPDPACMIVDVQMPGVSGSDLQAQLLAHGRRFPMIFMTAFPTDAIRRQVMEAGAHAYLSKPVDGDTMARCVDLALSTTPGRKGSIRSSPESSA